MALEINISTSLSKDCKTLYISDLTGYYDADTNPGGYDLTGVINLDPDDIDTSTGVLTFELVSTGDIVTVPIDSNDFEVSNIGTTGLINIPILISDLQNLGLGSFTDSIIKITYSYYDTDGNFYQAQCYILYDCNACCTLNSMLSNIDYCGTCSKTQVQKQINDLLMAKLILDSARYSLSCLDLTGAQKALDYVNSLIDVKKCDSCN